MAEKEEFTGVHMDEDVEATKEACSTTLKISARPSANTIIALV